MLLLLFDKAHHGEIPPVLRHHVSKSLCGLIYTAVAKKHKNSH